VPVVVVASREEMAESPKAIPMRLQLLALLSLSPLLPLALPLLALLGCAAVMLLAACCGHLASIAALVGKQWLVASSAASGKQAGGSSNGSHEVHIGLVQNTSAPASMADSSLEVFLAACKATASVGVISVMGIMLAWHGVLDSSGLKLLGSLAQKLIIPCLCFNSIAGNMSPAYLQDNWGLVVGGFAIIAIGNIVGHLLLPFAHVKPTFRPWFVLGCTFPNIFAIPLVFIEAICRDESESASQAEDCIAHASTRLFTFVMFFPLMVYGFGAVYAQRSLAALSDAKTSTSGLVQQQNGCIDAVEGETELAPAGDMTASNSFSSPVRKQCSGLGFCCPFWCLNSACWSHDQVKPTKDPSHAHGTGASDDVSGIMPQPKTEKAPTAVRETTLSQRVEAASDLDVTSCRWQLRAILLHNPPVLATVAAIAVALVSPLQSMLFGSSASLQFATNAFAVIGKAAPCVTNTAMAASLGCQLMKLQRFSDVFGGKNAGISRRTLGMLVFGKMIIIPAIFVVILILMQDSLPRDRWYRLILFIEAETPTANNVVLLATILGEVESAQILALCTVTQLVIFLPLSTLFVAVGLAMTDGLS